MLSTTLLSVSCMCAQVQEKHTPCSLWWLSAACRHVEEDRVLGASKQPIKASSAFARDINEGQQDLW